MGLTMGSHFFMPSGLACHALSFLLAAGMLAERAAGAAAAGPLRVHPTNPRYFTADGTKAVYVTGYHTHPNLLDYGGRTDPPAAFDYTAYLDTMVQKNHNFMRMWAWEQTRWVTWWTGAVGDNEAFFIPPIFVRTGPGTALDGKPKSDLTQFNPAYFDRLRSRVIAARDRGIYVAIMLFQGFSINRKTGKGNPWPGHPFHRDNNINGINGDPNGDGNGDEVHTLAVPAALAYQDAYVKKVIDTVNDLDNVLYEISNESWTDSKDWQYHMLGLIKTYEGGKPKQHPVWMSAIFAKGTWTTDTAALFSGPAEAISPADLVYGTDPPAADGRKVVIGDTDHIAAPRDTTDPAVARRWLWKAFVRGLHPIWMEGPNTNVGLVAHDVMGDTRSYAERMNLAALTPQNTLSSTAYCLASAGSQYLVYQPGSGAFTVNLAAGTYSYEWWNPATRAVAGTGAFAAGAGNRSFTPPFVGDAVLFLKAPARRGGDFNADRKADLLFRHPSGGDVHLWLMQ